MDDDNVVQFPKPPEPVEFLIGPFTEYRVMVEGRIIPRLTGCRVKDGVELVIDKRFGVTVPDEFAYKVAWLLSNAMAVAAGYAFLGSEDRSQPFAPKGMRLDEC